MTNAYAEQLEALIRDPGSEERKRFFGIIADVDATEVSHWIRAAADLRAHGVIDDDDEEYSPEMRALFAAYDARAYAVMAEYLRDLGYHELADLVERDHATFLDRSEVGASKLFDGE